MPDHRPAVDGQAAAITGAADMNGTVATAAASKVPEVTLAFWFIKILRRHWEKPAAMPSRCR